MNKAITDGVVFMPPKFRYGLDVWSTGDGTAGSDTFAGSAPGSFVTADPTFNGCLEVIKTTATLPVRHMGVTPILPGCYLQVRARVKAVSGALPTVRIAATPLRNGTPIAGYQTAGPVTTLNSYGEVMEIEAIIGTGNRNGVDLVWSNANGAHVGLDFGGATGAVVRIDDLQVEDITNVFLRNMLGLVDVRDYGAIGDGVADDSRAFDRADAAANGREIIVPRGTYRLDQNVTIQNRIRFEGRIVTPGNARLILQKNFDYAAYFDAFQDEELAFCKAYQALLNFSDHESLDLCGRRITITKPLDLRQIEGTKDRFETRRVIRNGMLEAANTQDWAPAVATSSARYARSAQRTLSDVANVANIEVGSLVTGTGVGREIYVTDRNIAARTLTLSQPLYDAEGTQVFTFTRFRYMLDFSGYEKLSQFQFADVELQCYGYSSGILLAKNGFTFQLRDCAITRPANRAITSIGRGCQDMMIDRCTFMSSEMDRPVADRHTAVFNVNANDTMTRDCRVVRFERFCVLGGTGHHFTGNHWFHGDDLANGIRKGGVIVANTNPQISITGNYIDNTSVEWTNEYEAYPENSNQYSFGGMTITGNTFVVSNVSNWFRFLIIKPYGPGHHINGFTCTGNVFRTFNSRIDRVDHVDTTFAGLDHTSHKNVVFDNNVFHGVNVESRNPLYVHHNQSSAQQSWVMPTGARLPFGGFCKWVSGVTPAGQLSYASGSRCSEMPAVFGYHGGTKDQILMTWSQPVSGGMRAEARMDNPL